MAHDADLTLPALLPDVTRDPLDPADASTDQRNAAEAVCDRVLRKAGAKIPAAYFQSAL